MREYLPIGDEVSYPALRQVVTWGGAGVDAGGGAEFSFLGRGMAAGPSPGQWTWVQSVQDSFQPVHCVQSLFWDRPTRRGSLSAGTSVLKPSPIFQPERCMLTVGVPSD